MKTAMYWWLLSGFLALSIWFGPDRALARVTFLSSFSAGQSYTSNLFFDEDDKQHDFGTFLGPNFEIRLDDPDIVIGATYSGRVVLFWNNSDANRYNQNANIILDLPFLTKRYENLTVSIDETMRFTPQLDAFSLSGAQDEGQNFGGLGQGGGGGQQGGQNAPGGGGLGGTSNTGIFTNRATTFVNNAGIRFGYAWNPRVQSTLGYTNRYRKFLNGDFQDSINHLVSKSLSYQLNAQTSLIPSYSYSLINFLGNGDDTDTSSDKIKVHSALMGVAHNFTGSLSASVSGGVAFSKQIGGTQQVPGPNGTTVTEELTEDWQTNFIGNANIQKAYTKGTMTATFNQRVGGGGGVAAQQSLNTTVVGRIQHNFNRRFTGFTSVGYARNDSIEGDAIDTQTYRIQAGVGYTFLAWLFGNFYYSHINQKSSGSAADDINVDSMFMGLTAVADPWYISR